MANAPRKAIIVSHFHWDREWYLTAHQFRVNLARMVGRVLDTLDEAAAHDGAFRHFLLDGQAIVLEDYLAVHPGDRGRIAAHAAAGRLSLGPWYILPDEFLVSGEATIRNLIAGEDVAGAVGPVQKVGYMPDSFGHVAQMPQILRGAGIDSFVFTRGMGDEVDELGHEFLWRAPDGSEVLAINQCEGYCNAGGLGYEEIWHAHTRREVDTARAVSQVDALFEKMAVHSNGDVYFLSNGCDHFPPQRDFDAILAALRDEFPDTEFVHGGLQDVVDAAREAGIATKTFQGELRRSRLSQVFPGVWSARMPLKQRNDECQTLLSGYLEPVSAYTHFCHGQPYPAGLIEGAWKLLMENHPHDSICGCSIDAVHRDMMPRFDGVEQTARQELVRQMEELTHTFARRAEDDRDTVLTVVNPLPVARREVVTRLVPLQPFRYRFPDLRLLDESGTPVEYTLLDVKTVERFWAVDYRVEPFHADQAAKFGVYAEHFGERILKSAAENDVHDTFVTIQFLADLPALGHASYTLTDRDADPLPDDIRHPSSVRARGSMIENEHVRVHLNPNGTFDVEHRATGGVLLGLNLLEDAEDVGDEYDYSPAAESTTITSARVRGDVRVVEETPLSVAVEAAFTLELPAGVDASRRRRRAEVAACDTRVRVRLTADSPVIEVETMFDNAADDHRLRALFPTPIRTDTLVSDGHFFVERRPLVQPAGEGWAQPPAPTMPQQEFSLVQDDAHGLAVLVRGLPEVEAFEGHNGGVTMALTLLRSVGWLSRDDFPTRSFSNAGPTIYTPEAQCRGRHRFRYALVPFAGDFIDAGVKGLSARYRTPALCIQGVPDGAAPGRSLVSISGDRAAVSAVKRHRSRDTLVVRLTNLTGEPVEGTLELGRDVARAWRTDLLEERTGELALGDARHLPVPLAPYQIATVEIEFR